MPETDPPTALMASALALIGDGATTTDLRERFDEAGATVTPDSAETLLAELARLGLVRVARSAHGKHHYVLTSIGHKGRDDALIGGRAEAERLAELERLRTDLLSTIAHELRTPLTAVRTSVGLLQDPNHPPDDEQRGTLLATIERNADRMQRLVGDILELARFRSGTVSLQLRRFDARELATAAVASLAPLARKRDQQVIIDIPGEPVWVYGDHRRLDQALVNLLSNAHKYSADGDAIRIAVEASEGQVRWTVTDHGPGIPAEERARLFERFFVGRADRSAGASGVGLGLPTTLAIAQAHGGNVEVESAVGEGSSFSLVVPASGPDEVDA